MWHQARSVYSVGLFLLLSPFYTCQARAVYSMYLFLFLSPFYTCYVKQGLFTMYLFLFLSPFYTCDVKQGLFTLFVFTFVSMLYMSCQALFSCLSSCYRPPCCTKHCLLSVDIKIKRSSAFLIIFVFVVSWQHVSLDWVYLCGCKCMLCTVCLADCICVCKPTVGYFMQDCICVCKPTVHDTR